MNNKYRSIKVLLIIVVTALLSSVLTYSYVRRMYNPRDEYILYFKKDEVAMSDIYKFSEVWNLLEDNFLYDIDERQMFEGAVAGLAAGLKDPYTIYYTKDQMKQLQEYSSSSYVGVGMIVSETKEGYLEVIESVIGGPAHTAGIKEGDLLMKVNGEDITTEDSDVIVNRIKGAEGTDVSITVYRPSSLLHLDFTMTRKKVHIPSVKSETLEKDIGYIRITMFDTMVATDFYNELNALLKKGIKGLIVDVRDNPGGSYDQVVSIADMLLPEAVILYTEDKNGNREYERSAASHINIPTVILVNERSASASEVLAGALQDNDRAEIVGTQTYGKGVVQAIIPTKDGSGVRVTIAGYYTPDGNVVQDVGISPDRRVEIQGEYKGSAVSSIPREEDTQLSTAMEVMRGMLAK
ncbi:MAG TPA: S41 family peptidase [Clostridiales bacterium]|nr:S41 family peptidase [Clostridiales bacterium]